MITERQSPEMIAQAALQEGVDAVGLGILSGAHKQLLPEVTELMREKGIGEVLVKVEWQTLKLQLV